MKVALIGAGGDVGRQVLSYSIQERLLCREDVLFLIGRKDGPSRSSLFGILSDLEDACMEFLPKMEVLLSPEEIDADLVIMCAGITFPTDPRKKAISRENFAEINANVFNYYAKALSSKSKESLVIQVSNPIELGVQIFSRYHDRRCVVGMGAYLDSLRFQREIARSLQVERSRVRGWVAGEHGPEMIPLWSTVSIAGMTPTEEKKRISALRSAQMNIGGAQALKNALWLIEKEGPEAAFAMIDSLPFDLRPIVRPFTTHYTGSKTIFGPAIATCQLIRGIIKGEERLVMGQTRVEGEFLGLHGVIGVPLILGRNGIERIIEIDLWEEEAERLRESVERINEKYERYG